MVAQDWALQARAPWRWLAPRRLPRATAAFGPDFRTALATPPALAIGCGRQGALASRLARERDAWAVQILDPRIDPHLWDLVVVPEHDRVRGPNVITLLGSLHPVDDAWLAQARLDHAAQLSTAGAFTALLVGGASAHAHLDDAGFDALLATLLARTAADGEHLWITASRRTPATWRARLEALRSTANVRVWCDERDGPNPYAALLAGATRIVCTADSVNMLSEACATHAPVFVAGVDALQGRPRAFVDALLARGRLQRVDASLAPFDVTPLRETERVARLVRERLAAA